MENIQEAEPVVKSGSGGFINQDEIIRQFGIKNGMTIADFGCGAGYFSLPIARLLNNTGTVYAVDVLTAPLESVMSQAKLYGLVNIEKVRANVEVVGGTGIDEHKVDLVILANILFQCQDQDSLFEEAKRVLAPGGNIAVIDWVPSKVAIGPKFEHCLSEDEAKRIAMRNGLKVTTKLHTGDTHYGFILELV